MVWLFNLFWSLCPFCKTSNSSFYTACSACALQLNALKKSAPIQTEVQNLRVYSCSFYQDYLKELLLIQKSDPNPIVVEWLAEWLIQVLKVSAPEHWRNCTLLFVPSSPLQKLHLIEELALQLHRYGLPLILNPMLLHTAKPVSAQKTLSILHRSNNSNRFYTNTTRANVSEAILVDDILTTGQTLLSCKARLEQDIGLKVRGALTLAYTKKKA